MSARPDPNLELVKAMGSTRGYDPMPPAQHEWQMTKGQPTKYRLWSWLCAHTIRARGKPGEQKIRTAYATQDDGKKPATLIHAARDLNIDLGQLSIAWSEGVEDGLWRRDGETRWLYLNGDVSAGQVLLAAKKRRIESTSNLSKIVLLQIKALPEEAKAATLARLKASRQYNEAQIAAAVAEKREAWAAMDDTILRAVAIERKRTGRHAPPPAPLPQMLLEFVQSTTAQSGETLRAESALPYSSSETPQRAPAASSKGIGVAARSDAEPEPDPSKVSNVPIALPPDKAAAETPRRQPAEPSKGGAEQSGDQDALLAEPVLYAAAIRQAADEAGIAPNPTDAETIATWRQKRIPVETVSRAIYLGALRQLVSTVNRAGSSHGVNSLRYFDGAIIDEVRDRELDTGPGFWEHTRERLKRELTKLAASEHSKTAGGAK